MDADVEQDETFEFFEYVHSMMENELNKKNIPPK